MTELHTLEQQLLAAWPPGVWRDVTVVVAVSGGADSVALLRALAAVSQQPPGRLVVAHFNHQLRGQESDEDERFVRRLSQQLNLPLEVGAACSLGDGPPLRQEAELRQRRYRFLEEVAERTASRYVATAHTADDQAETVLHRIVRGTSLAGLSGIPVSRRLNQLTTIVRPMLAIDRALVLQYLSDRNQPHRVDSSNHSLDYTRNRIRHQLLPLLAQHYNPQVSHALLRLSRLAGEAQDLIGSWVDSLIPRCVIAMDSHCARLDRSILRRERPFLLRELLREIWHRQHWPRQAMGERKWQQLGSLIQSSLVNPPGITLPGNIQVTVDEEVVELRRAEAGDAGERRGEV